MPVVHSGCFVILRMKSSDDNFSSLGKRGKSSLLQPSGTVSLSGQRKLERDISRPFFVK